MDRKQRQGVLDRSTAVRGLILWCQGVMSAYADEGLYSCCQGWQATDEIGGKMKIVETVFI